MIRHHAALPRKAAAITLLAAAAALAAHPAAAAARSGPPTSASGSDWTTYQHDNSRSGFQASDPAINASSVGTLASKWIFRASDSISSQAIAANGLIYWGSWDGLEHATNPATGTDVWSSYLGDETNTNCSPPHLGVASTATVATIKINGTRAPVLFVGGGNGSYYALNANTGKIIWSVPFGSPAQGYFSWSSPALYNGSIYVGISSIGDCPLVPGKLVKLNATNGTQQAAFNTTPPGAPARASGHRPQWTKAPVTYTSPPALTGAGSVASRNPTRRLCCSSRGTCR